MVCFCHEYFVSKLILKKKKTCSRKVEVYHLKVSMVRSILFSPISTSFKKTSVFLDI